MNKNVGYWIIGAAFLVQLLFVPWETARRRSGVRVGDFYGYLPVFARQVQDGRAIRLDVETLATHLIVTALVAVAYAYLTREKRKG